ncbi:MAG: DUF3592 domain-containing protein [Thermodesulfobacteriota bacterium]
MIWLLFICGVLFIGYTLSSVYVGYRSRYWPFIMGRIKDSTVATRTTTASSSKHYHPAVVYSYKVRNKRYSNNKIGNYVGFGNDENFAKGLISKYPQGSEVKVYYCPLYPRVSVLAPGMNQRLVHVILLFTGTVVVSGTFPALFTENPSWFLEKIFGVIDYFF